MGLIGIVWLDSATIGSFILIRDQSLEEGWERCDSSINKSQTWGEKEFRADHTRKKARN